MTRSAFTSASRISPSDSSSNSSRATSAEPQSTESGQPSPPPTRSIPRQYPARNQSRSDEDGPNPQGKGHCHGPLKAKSRSSRLGGNAEESHSKLLGPQLRRNRRGCRIGRTDLATSEGDEQAH